MNLLKLQELCVADWFVVPWCCLVCGGGRYLFVAWYLFCMWRVEIFGLMLCMEAFSIGLVIFCTICCCLVFILCVGNRDFWSGVVCGGVL